MVREDVQEYNTKNPVARLCIQNFLKSVITLVKNINIHNIIDIGCGSGFVIHTIQDAAAASVQLHGLDNDEESLTFARKLNPGAFFSKGDIYHLDIADSSYDLVLCLEVLEHLADYRKALSEIKRMSRAYCLISVPQEPYFRITELLRGKYLSRFGNHPGHLNNWSSKAFRRLLEEYFTIKSFKTPFPWQLALCEV